MHQFSLQCPSPKLSPVYVIIASLLRVTSPCGFFLCVPVCLGMLHKKFRRSQTKPLCLVGFVRDRIRAALYQIGSIMDAKTFSSSHISMEDKRVAFELWKGGWFPLKNIREHIHLLKCSMRHIIILKHAKSQGEDIDDSQVPDGVHALAKKKLLKICGSVTFSSLIKRISSDHTPPLPG